MENTCSCLGGDDSTGEIAEDKVLAASPRACRGEKQQQVPGCGLLGLSPPVLRAQPLTVVAAARQPALQRLLHRRGSCASATRRLRAALDGGAAASPPHSAAPACCCICSGCGGALRRRRPGSCVAASNRGRWRPGRGGIAEGEVLPAAPGRPASCCCICCCSGCGGGLHCRRPVSCVAASNRGRWRRGSCVVEGAMSEARPEKNDDGEHDSQHGVMPSLFVEVFFS